MLELFVPGLFTHLTLRIAGAAMVSFLLGLLFVPLVIKYGRRRGFKDREGKTHSIKLNELHQKKKDTPVLGGLAILGAALLSTFVFAHVASFYVLLGAGTLAALGAIGLLDDFVKTFGKDKREGLTPKQKLAAQIGVGLAVGALLVLFHEHVGSNSAFALEAQNADPPPASRGEGVGSAAFFALRLPCTTVAIPLGAALFVAFTALVLTASSNAVNLTDGLDGLAGGCYVLAIAVQGVLAYVASRADWCQDLGLVHVPGAGEVAVLCAALAGGTLAFLWFNAHPADLFMGDAGSLPLGGALGIVAVITKHELLLPLVALVFVAEACSVILQVAFFKATGRRVLACAPLHHHFEFKGWAETKVVFRFWIAALLASLASLATLAVRP